MQIKLGVTNKMRNRIREVRKIKKVTQAKLVKNISITRQYISLIELGEETPSLKVANEIAIALGMSMYAVFDLDISKSIVSVSCY